MPLTKNVKGQTSSGVRARFSLLALRQNLPFDVTIELTLLCNWKCVHCYNFDRSKPIDRTLKSEALADDEILILIDQVAAAGCFELTFTGGEVLLHPHLLEFVKRARQQHLSVRLKSNGSLFDEDKLKSLDDLGVCLLDLSLHGAVASTHDHFTQTPGSFDAMRQNARLAKDLGWRLSFSLSVSKNNHAEVEGMLALAESFDASVTLDHNITGRYDGVSNSLDWRLEPEALKAIYQGPAAELLSPPVFSENRLMQCSCAKGKCAISSTGDVYPCIGAPIPSGNIREQSFADIWQRSPVLNRIRNLKHEDFSSCQGCDLRPYCQRSSGAVYANTGDYTAAEPWVCQEAAVLKDIHENRSTNKSP